ncbi:MAG: hypothetical protein AAF604_04645 [Acidobacteriota bacterium]
MSITLTPETLTGAAGIITGIVAFVQSLRARSAAAKAAARNVQAEIENRLHAISGGRIASLEHLVVEAGRESRLLTSPVAVVSERDEIWRELRASGFRGAQPASADGEATIAVVDGELDEEAIGAVRSPYVLLYKTGAPYRGKMPPAQVTFANSLVTLDARLRELLRYAEGRA